MSTRENIRLIARAPSVTHLTHNFFFNFEVRRFLFFFCFFWSSIYIFL